MNQLIDKPKDSDFMPAADVHNLLGTGNDGKVIENNVAIPVTSPEIDAELPLLNELDLNNGE